MANTNAGLNARHLVLFSYDVTHHLQLLLIGQLLCALHFVCLGQPAQLQAET